MGIRTWLHQHTILLLSALVGAVALAVHLLPFLLFGSNPLGYDTGFYRRYLIQPFTSFPNPAVPGLGPDALVPRLILDLLRVIGVPTDLVLYGVYVACFVALPVLVFFWLLPSGQRTALIGGLLVTLSPVGYTAYSYMLLKNAWALCLMVLAYICFERRWIATLLVLDVGIALSHKTTAIVYVASLCVLEVLHRRRLREIILHIGVTTLCFLMVNTSLPSEVVRSSPVGVFLDWQEYLTLSIPLLIAGVVAVVTLRKVPVTLAALAAASAAFPLFSLPFYERIFVFTDLALAGVAAYGINALITRINFRVPTVRTYAYFGLVCVIVGLTLGSLETQINNLRPSMTRTDVARVRDIARHVPEGATILTSTDEAPWYEGWTLAHVAAPGMLQDTHNLEEWTALWESTTTEASASFLASFPPPLYVSTSEEFGDLIGHRPVCLKEITPTLFKSECK